jgi:hypothetical protein
MRKKTGKKIGWDDLIAYAETKLASAQLKVVEIETLIAIFKAQAKAGAPTPLEMVVTKEGRNNA